MQTEYDEPNGIYDDVMSRPTYIMTSFHTFMLYQFCTSV